MKLSKYLILIVFMVSVFSCKTKKTNTDKTSSKTEVVKEETKAIVKDSASVKKEVVKINTAEEKENTVDNKSTEKVIVFFPEKDINGNQLIASISTKEIAIQEKSKSYITTDQIKTFIDSLKSNYSEILNIKIDSIGESQSKIKTIEADSTLGANIPWWVWLVGIIALLVFLAFKIK